MTGRTWSIYSLSDPRTGDVRYVGFATRLRRRFTEHISAKRERTHKANWIKSLLKLGLRPVMSVIETGIGNGWQERERFWISHYRATGAQITNMTDGGDGVLGAVQSAETRKKQADALRGKKRPAEVFVKAIATKKANGPTEKQIAACRRMAEGNRGRKETAERVQQKREFMTGRKVTWSREAKARQKGKNKGVAKSPETRAKMAASWHLFRGPMSAETRAKISAARSRRNA